MCIVCSEELKKTDQTDRTNVQTQNYSNFVRILKKLHSPDNLNNFQKKLLEANLKNNLIEHKLNALEINLK